MRFNVLFQQAHILETAFAHRTIVRLFPLLVLIAIYSCFSCYRMAIHWTWTEDLLVLDVDVQFQIGDGREDALTNGTLQSTQSSIVPAILVVAVVIVVIVLQAGHGGTQGVEMHPIDVLLQDIRSV